MPRLHYSARSALSVFPNALSSDAPAPAAAALPFQHQGAMSENVTNCVVLDIFLKNYAGTAREITVAPSTGVFTEGVEGSIVDWENSIRVKPYGPAGNADLRALRVAEVVLEGQPLGAGEAQRANRSTGVDVDIHTSSQDFLSATLQIGYHGEKCARSAFNPIPLGEITAIVFKVAKSTKGRLRVLLAADSADALP